MLRNRRHLGISQGSFLVPRLLNLARQSLFPWTLIRSQMSKQSPNLQKLKALHHQTRSKGLLAIAVAASETNGLELSEVSIISLPKSESNCVHSGTLQLLSPVNPCYVFGGEELWVFVSLETVCSSANESGFMERVTAWQGSVILERGRTLEKSQDGDDSWAYGSLVSSSQGINWYVIYDWQFVLILDTSHFLLNVPLWWLGNKRQDWSHIVFVHCNKTISLWV